MKKQTNAYAACFRSQFIDFLVSQPYYSNNHLFQTFCPGPCTWQHSPLWAWYKQTAEVNLLFVINLK